MDRSNSRARRKRAATKDSSSRWASTITRTSEDAFQLGRRNLGAQAASLRARVSVINQRLAVRVWPLFKVGTPTSLLRSPERDRNKM